MNDSRDRMWRALPFVMAMLLTALIPLNAAALFGRGRTEETPPPGAPVAQDLELKAYRGVPCTGTLKAVDDGDGALTFRVVTPPEKGTLELGEDGVFVYTPDRDRAGTDRFTYTATDAGGATGAPAEVKIRISRVASGVEYADTARLSCATAAVDLAERGVFTGSRVGGDWFFEPERAVTRGEFVAMAMAAAGLDGSDVTVTGFCDDEQIPSWAKGCAAGALAAGVVYGTPTEEGMAFRAGSEITLSEAAAVLDRVLKVTDVDLAALGGEERPAWCAQAVANLESVSIAPVGGFSGESLSRGLTRGEAAELLSAAMTLADARTKDTGFWGRLF